MPVFLKLSHSNISDPTFWSALNIDTNSTIDVSRLSGQYQITLTASSISFKNTMSGITTTYTDADLAAGSFSQLVEFIGNNSDNFARGSVGLNSSGYVGGSGDDTLIDDGNLGGQITGGSGDDLIYGGSGDNVLHGNAGNDTIYGVAGQNYILGGAGNDVIYAGTGGDVIDAGAGNDTVYGGYDTVYVAGGSGVNTLYIPAGATYAPYSPGGVSGTVFLPDGHVYQYNNFQIVQQQGAVCLAHGTRVTTPGGPVAVQDLRPGDLVETLDNGRQAIRWVGNQTLSAQELSARPCLRPIRIRAGALGAGCPQQDLIVSPQHRVLIRSKIAIRLFNTGEVLMPAKKLLGLHGIEIAQDLPAIRYYHFMCDAHELVWAEGAPVETLFLGPEALKSLSPEALREIRQIFGQDILNGHLSARITPRGKQARELIQRHQKNKKALLATTA